ncbi:unnamed protein product [Ectocarpus sp. CCAP 1310/34]|nr:unnamed protein product [Ectocarpus sp. CCAP 1310/34]
MLFGGIWMLFETLTLASLGGLAQKQHAAGSGSTAASSAFVSPPSSGTTPVRLFRHVNVGSSGGGSGSIRRYGNGNVTCRRDARAVGALNAGSNGNDLGEHVPGSEHRGGGMRNADAGRLVDWDIKTRGEGGEGVFKKEMLWSCSTQPTISTQRERVTCCKVEDVLGSLGRWLQMVGRPPLHLARLGFGLSLLFYGMAFRTFAFHVIVFRISGFKQVSLGKLAAKYRNARQSIRAAAAAAESAKRDQEHKAAQAEKLKVCR